MTVGGDWIWLGVLSSCVEPSRSAASELVGGTELLVRTVYDVILNVVIIVTIWCRGTFLTFVLLNINVTKFHCMFR